MRLHAGILACVHHIPYIPISYGPKTDNLIKVMEIEELMIQSTELNMDYFEKKWNFLTENYVQLQTKMKEKHEFFHKNL
jgi:polysaccharide pyruvyl transferase WcaK-like protein